MNNYTSNIFPSDVTDYNDVCFVIKLVNNVTCNWLLPNTVTH